MAVTTTWLIAPPRKDSKILPTCGYCYAAIDGEPYQKTSSPGQPDRYRCGAHAIGGVDEAAIAQARADKAAADVRARVETPIAAGTNQRALPLDRPRGFQSLAGYIDKRLPTGDRE